MRYRRLDENHDFSFGRGHGDYLVDSVENPEAVSQAIKTRLLLFLGEWWEDVGDGLPLWQQILGQRTVDNGIIDRLLTDRIRSLQMPDGTYPVIAVHDTNSIFDPETRGYSFSCTVETVYGKVYVTNADQGGN